MPKKTTQATEEPSQSQQQGDVELSQQPPAPPAWWSQMENASERGFFVTRIGSAKIDSAMEDTVALLKAAATEYAKHTGDTKPYETGVASAIPGVENIGFVALSPEDATTDVARLGRWLMLKLASGQEVNWPRPTHISRMLPMEGVTSGTVNESGLVNLATSILPNHCANLSETGMKTAKYETLYEEFEADDHLTPSLVNRVMGELLPEGYEANWIKPDYSILVVAVAGDVGMSVVEKYDDCFNFAVHKAMPKLESKDVEAEAVLPASQPA